MDGDVMTSRAVKEAEAIYEWAHTLLTHVRAAEHALDTAQAGWPTSVPGSAPAEGGQGGEGWCNEHPLPCLEHPDALRRFDLAGPFCAGHPLPCPDHPTGSAHIVERTAGHDNARRQLDQLRDNIHTIASNGKLQRAAKVAQAWGTPVLDKTTIAEKLVDATKDPWCVHCAKIGQRNTRKPGGDLCVFCDEFKTKWKRPPSKRIWDCYLARGCKLYPNDVERIHREEKLEAEERKREEKRIAKADERASKAS